MIKYIHEHAVEVIWLTWILSLTAITAENTRSYRLEGTKGYVAKSLFITNFRSGTPTRKRACTKGKVGSVVETTIGLKVIFIAIIKEICKKSCYSTGRVKFFIETFRALGVARGHSVTN